jgi:hypothetical protein
LETIGQLAFALGVAPSAFFEGVPPPEEDMPPAPVQRVMTLLERQPRDVQTLAESLVNAVIRDARTKAVPALDGRPVASASQAPKRLSKAKPFGRASTRKRT